MPRYYKVNFKKKFKESPIIEKESIIDFEKESKQKRLWLDVHINNAIKYRNVLDYLICYNQLGLIDFNIQKKKGEKTTKIEIYCINTKMTLFLEIFFKFKDEGLDDIDKKDKYKYTKTWEKGILFYKLYRIGTVVKDAEGNLVKKKKLNILHLETTNSKTFDFIFSSIHIYSHQDQLDSMDFY